MTDTPPAATTASSAHEPRGGTRRFVRHYLEMVAAMVLGMMTLHPLWRLATSATASEAWARQPEVDLLAMATAMSLPMAAWMWHRGHRLRPVLEMCAAMYAGFVVFFPLLWTGQLSASGVSVGGHVLMLVLMLGAMLWRREEYAAPCGRQQRAADRQVRATS